MSMNDEYDWDIFEAFKEQVYLQLPKVEENILNLGDASLAKDSIDELFRTFHSYKPNTEYLSLTPFHNIVVKTESVLATLRESQKDQEKVDDTIVEWFLQILDYITIFSKEMELNKTLLTAVPKELLNSIKITSAYVKPADKLKTLTLLYVDIDEKRAKQVSSFLNKLSAGVHVVNSREDANKHLSAHSVDILVTNLNKENHSLISHVKRNFKNLPVVAIFAKLTALCSKELLKKGISHATTNPLSAKSLNRELLSIVKIYFSSSNIIINHKKISSFIETLEPLPNTIFQIMQICDDEEMSVKELIKVVKTDPIISAHILNIANSPLYGNIELKTIDQAVAKFGKSAVKALSMSGMYNSLGSIDLSAYSMDEHAFSKVSMQRLSLMLKWYAKVSIADLSILSATALLGNIGQLLLSKEIKECEEIEHFQTLCTHSGIAYAEEVILSTTTNIISSQILNYWNLSKDIVDVISYSDNPNEAPQEIKKLCVANYIIYTLVDIKGNIAESIPEFLLPTLAESGFDPKHLSNALESIQS